MGAASSGGSDNDVSGAEAVITGGTTYSSRKTKTVNKSIADQNRANRQSRKSPVTKLFEASLIGKGTKAISESKFVRDNNLKRRKAFATKKGLRVSDMSDDFILSSGFKTQLDGLGYSKEPGNVGRDNDNNQSAQPVIVKKNIGGTEVQTTETKLAENETESEEYDARKTKRRGRRKTILTSQRGASGNLVLGKPTLLGA
jgi:hypothetical protein